MRYNHEQAARIAASKFIAASHAGAINVRVEEAPSGGYRAVYDHTARIGRRGSDKKMAVTCHLIAGWHVQLPADLWALLQTGADLTADQASALRAALEPMLPRGWRFGERWYEGGAVSVIRPGRGTMVTSHCYE